MDELKFYTTDEVAALLHVTRRTLYRYIKAGQLRTVRMGRSMLIPAQALKDFAERGTERGYLDIIGENYARKKEREQAETETPAAPDAK